MKNILIIFCVLLTTIRSVYCQESSEITLANVDSINIARANNVAYKVLGTESQSLSYLVFSVDNNLLFIHKTCTGYKLHSFNEEFNFESQKKELNEEYDIQIEQDSILERMFTMEICNKPFVYSKTDSLSKNYAHWDAKYIYFRICKNGVKECEFNLPTSYTIDVDKKKIIPIDQEIFNYLFGKLVKEKKYK